MNGPQLVKHKALHQPSPIPLVTWVIVTWMKLMFSIIKFYRFHNDPQNWHKGCLMCRITSSISDGQWRDLFFTTWGHCIVREESKSSVDQNNGNSFLKGFSLLFPGKYQKISAARVKVFLTKQNINSIWPLKTMLWI